MKKGVWKIVSAIAVILTIIGAYEMLKKEDPHSHQDVGFWHVYGVDNEDAEDIIARETGKAYYSYRISYDEGTIEVVEVRTKENGIWTSTLLQLGESVRVTGQQVEIRLPRSANGIEPGTAKGRFMNIEPQLALSQVNP